MKLPLIAMVCIGLLQFSVDADEKSPPSPFGDFNDPRQTISIYEWIRDGKPEQRIRQLNNSILIICWMPDSNGKFESYQISGIDGFHSRERIELFLHAFYALDQPKEVGTERLNVIVAGNNWGAGIALKEKLMALSKEHKFSVFYAGGWAFRKARLIEEPEARQAMIREAFLKTNNSEQDGADQPATAPESKPEGDLKPQPESEGRFQ
jgi:hypothetical protein